LVPVFHNIAHCSLRAARCQARYSSLLVFQDSPPQAYKQELKVRSHWVIFAFVLCLHLISKADGQLLPVTPSSRTSTGGHKWALVVGINDYTQLPSLRFARQDAEVVAKALRERCGFVNENIALLTDCRDCVSNASKRFPKVDNLRSHIKQLVQQAGLNDLLLFVFFGQGLTMDGMRYLVPADGVKGDPSTLISHAWIKTVLEEARTRQRLLILDDCHSLAPATGKGELLELAPGPLAGADFLTLTACDLQQFSHDDELVGHSEFAIALVDGLTGEADRVAVGNRDGILTANELFEYSAMRVKQWSLANGHAQTPVLRGESRVRVELVVSSVPSALLQEAEYLTKDSTDAGSLMGSFERVTNRFDKTGVDRVHDRLLDRTWIVLRDPQDPCSTQRMDWETAQNAATRLGARLPSLAELKTLITRERDEHQDVFASVIFFPPSTRTKKCWAVDNLGMFRPFQRCYVDFGRPDWGMTSMSEIHTVFLIEDK